jgi:adenylosuccinate synthase
MIVHKLSLEGEVVVYRDNGGANAGHTVEFPDGTRVSLHQLPSGIFIKGATVVLGKEMVLHPGDLVAELADVAKVKSTNDRARVLIDELAILSLDTHRAYEGVLKQWQSGGSGSTGRGISPAYADVLLRHPLRMRDVVTFDEAKVNAHYDLYAALITGLGHSLENVEVATLSGEKIKVGTKKQFIERLKSQVTSLSEYSTDIHGWLSEKWSDESCGFVFEKAQAVGLDCRWGVYPDVTASDTTLAGIFSATEGIVDPEKIMLRAGVIKATYMSSVGSRVLPTLMEAKYADRIRKDAHEYGATTKRPRDIAYLDVPALQFFTRVGRLNSLVLTHMDICYADQPIKICTEYTRSGKTVDYRPDQHFLNTVKPVYMELPAWNIEKLHAAKTFKQLPKEAQQFIRFLEEKIGVPVSIITTGPQRDQGLILQKM